MNPNSFSLRSKGAKKNKDGAAAETDKDKEQNGGNEETKDKPT